MVFRTVGNLYILGLFGAFFSFWYNMLMAKQFGTGKEVEAFFAAVVLYGTMMKISQAGYLSDILLPHYFQVRKEWGKEAAFGLISVFVNLFFLAGFAISGLYLVFASFIFNLMVGGFDQATRDESIRFFWWIAPLMPFQVAMIAVKQLLNAEKQFAKIELTSVVGSMVSVATILTLDGWLGVRVLVLNVILIEALQIANAAWYLRKLEYRHRFRIRSPHISMREILLKLGSTSGYLVSVQILEFAFNHVLSLLPQGTFAVYRYAERVFRRSHSLILSPVTTVMKVVINESVSSSKAGSMETVRKALYFGLLASTGFLGVFVACGKDAVPFLFGSDQFPLVHLAQSRILLTAMFATMVATMVDAVYQNTGVALGKGKSNFLLRIGMNLASAGLAVWLMGSWEFEGLLAYRFANSGLGLAIALGLIWATDRDYLAPLLSRHTLRIMAATGGGLLILVPLNPYLRPLGGGGALPHLINATLQALLYLVITYALARWLRIGEVALLEEKARNVFRKLRKAPV